MNETYHPDEFGSGHRIVSRTLQPDYDDLPDQLTEAELDEASSFYAAQRETRPSIEWGDNAGFTKHTHTHQCGHICRAAFCIYNGNATPLCVSCQVAHWENRTA